MSIFGRFWQSSPARRDRTAAGKSGARAYAVGDVHGCLGLLDDLLARIERDNAGRPPRKTYVVFLGDLIDRGPDSAGVVERLRTWRPSFATPIFLGGNHEEILVRILSGEPEILTDWLKFGGAECLQSYDVDPSPLRDLDPAVAAERIRAAIPRKHVDFIDGFADTFRFGDYLFVHAGIRPGVELEQQDPFDLRWIREPFLSHDESDGTIVVHGHTIVDEVEERGHRIGLDTGAYQTGVLTALGIEDEARWYLSTDAVSEGGALADSQR